MLLFKKSINIASKMNLFKTYPKFSTEFNHIQKMPVLKNFMQHLKNEFGENFTKLPHRNSTLLIMIQQGFGTIRPLMDSIHAVGIQPKQIMLTTKPHTTSLEMQEYLNGEFGTNYVQFQWPTDAVSLKSKILGKTPYQVATEETHKMLLDKVCEYLLRYPAPSEIKNILICDEGGNFLELFIERYRNPDTSYTKKLSDYAVVAVEHTKCGTHSKALRRLPFPLINMADSYLKTRVASEFIAKSMFANLKSVLSNIPRTSNINFGVVGMGNIGKELIYFLIKEYPEIPILLYDNEPSVFSAAEIRKNGLNNSSRVETLRSLFQQATIILGCTGKDITLSLSLDDLTTNPANHIHFISCSSGNREFHSLLKKITDYQFKNRDDICDWTMQLSSETLQKFTVYNAGFPINFHAKPSSGVPAAEIQITRSMTLAVIVQALKLFEVMLYKKNQEGYIQLDVHYQYKIVQLFYNELVIKNDFQKSDLSPEKYGEIFQNDIEKNSIGVPQINLSEIVPIRFYVQTNYQVKMFELLELQKCRIKRMALCGTAGSGKTVLAEYYLSRYQQLYPQHICKILPAETQEEWDNSLQGWVQLLNNKYASLISNTTDAEKQKHFIIQLIKSELKKNSWCIVVDNWDIKNGPQMGEIEALFNEGEGTLIITTQAQSPFRQLCSINLSSGFSQEESRQLFLKVNNDLEMFKANVSQLDVGQNLNSLLHKLHYLPLAIVQAGSYILWENKSRLQLGQSLLSCHDYEKLIHSKINELVEKHQQLLKNKADIPRDYVGAHPEFMLIKTQEAAIDLSIEKALFIHKKLNETDLLEVLFYCSFINNSNIPQKLLKHLLHYSTTNTNTNDNIDSRFEAALNTAKNYSLLHFDNIRSPVDDLFSVQLHRITQKVIREKYWPLYMSILNKGKLIVHINKDNGSIINMGGAVTEAFLYSKIMSEFSKLLKKSIENRDNNLILNIYKNHAFMLTNMFNLNVFISQELPSDSFGAVVDFYNTIASVEQELGNYRSAEKILRINVIIYLASYTAERPLHLITVHRNLAVVLDRLGKYEEAENIYKENLRLVATYTGDEIKRKKIELVLKHDLIKLLHTLGRVDEAQHILQEIPQIMQLSNNIETIQAKNNLAHNLYASGKIIEAVNLFQEILSLEIKHYGTEDHIEVATTQSSLGMLLDKIGEPAQAKVMLLKALQISISHYGTAQHERVASIQNNLAIILNVQKKYSDAETLYREALKTLIERYGSENMLRVADTQFNLATNLKSVGRKIEAIEFFRKALKTHIIHFKAEKQLSIAKDQRQLADLLTSVDCYQEAEELLTHSLAIYKAYYKTERHLVVADTQQALATVLMLQHFYAKAIVLYQQSLTTEISQNAAQNHINIAFTQCNLAQALVKLKRYAEAEEQFNTSLKTVTSSVETESRIQVAIIHQRIGDYFKLVGRYDESAAQFQLTLEIFQTYFNNVNNHLIANIKCDIGAVLTILERNKEAEVLFSEALSIKIALYGTEKHPEIESIQKNLVNILLKLNMNTEAENLKDKIASQRPDYEKYFDKEKIAMISFVVAEGMLMLKLAAEAINVLEERKLFQEAKIVQNILVDSWEKEYAEKVSTTIKKKTIVKKENILSEYNHVSPDRLIRCAAGNGQEKDLLTLIRCYPDKVNAIDQNPTRGWTALHWAIRNKHFDCVKVLLESGAKYNIAEQSTEKSTAIDIALQNEDKNILYLLGTYFIKMYARCDDFNMVNRDAALEAAILADDKGAVNLLKRLNNEHCNVIYKENSMCKIN